MPKEVIGEEVHRTPRAIGGYANIVNRMNVPGGWLYVHTLTQFRTFGGADHYVSTVFVPDPHSPG
jgi:hypothetical protein